MNPWLHTKTVIDQDFSVGNGFHVVRLEFKVMRLRPIRNNGMNINLVAPYSLDEFRHGIEGSYHLQFTGIGTRPLSTAGQKSH